MSFLEPKSGPAALAEAQERARAHVIEGRQREVAQAEQRELEGAVHSAAQSMLGGGYSPTAVAAALADPERAKRLAFYRAADPNPGGSYPGAQPGGGMTTHLGAPSRWELGESPPEGAEVRGSLADLLESVRRSRAVVRGGDESFRATSSLFGHDSSNAALPAEVDGANAAYYGDRLEVFLQEQGEKSDVYVSAETRAAAANVARVGTMRDRSEHEFHLVTQRGREGGPPIRELKLVRYPAQPLPFYDPAKDGPRPPAGPYVTKIVSVRMVLSNLAQIQAFVDRYGSGPMTDELTRPLRARILK